MLRSWFEQRWIAVALFALFTCGLTPALADPAPSGFTEFTLVSAVRVSRTHIEYTYRAKAQNDATAVKNVSATAASGVASTVIIDGNLSFPDMAANQAVFSTDTFIFRQDRRVGFDPNVLTFDFTFSPANAPPIANAGANQNVATGDVVTLNGAGSSDPDGDPLTYVWSLTSVPAGSGASLSNASSVNSSFTADVAGAYLVRLVVNDGTVDSNPSSISVTATTANAAPTAEAGPAQNVATGDVVTLNGAGSSDPDGDTLTYAWSLTSVPAGSGATLSNASSPSPSFTADIAGTYMAQLIVNDGAADSNPSSVSITATTVNAAPIADAGANQNVAAGDIVTLNGAGSSDPDGDPLTYAWSLISVPAGSGATLSNASSASSSFTADVAGTYLVRLVVNDGNVDSAPATVNIAASAANVAPTANAGADRLASIGQLVLLDGSGSSDPNGDPLAFAWSLTSVPMGSIAALSDPTSASPGFTADVAGSYTAQLIVNDGTGDSAPDSVTITTNLVTIAIASPIDGLLTTAASVTVSGTLSAPPQSVVVNGVTASFGGGSFSADVPLREGANMITAVATEASGATSTATVEVTRDTTAPIVQIGTPLNDFQSANNVITVAGQVNDSVRGAVLETVKVNGLTATVQNGSFVVTGVPLVRGPNKLEAVATDEAGNVGRSSINVIFEQPAGARVTAFSGDGQSGDVGEELSERLVVRVVDDLGNPVAGRMVKFEVTRNDGSLSTLVGGQGNTGRMLMWPTNGNGEASVVFKLGSAAGAGVNQVRATAVGAAGSVEFCATGEPKPAFQIVASMGFSQRAAVGQPTPAPLEVFVTDDLGNPASGVDVTFDAVAGGANFGGAQSIVRTTGPDGKARATMTTGLTPGINNNRAVATVAGLTGLPATFVASVFAAADPADTTFSGVVLDNALTPIPGADVTIVGTNVAGVTDRSGQFQLTNVPVGHILLHIDPSNSPRSETFPPLEFETTTIAGIDNILGQPIEIPPIDAGNGQVVGGAQNVTLTMQNVPGMAITVFANSATFPNGSSTGQMSISQVAGDKVPMAPPNGIIFTPPVWTFQPAGVHFNPPARVQMPNTDGFDPGVIIDMYQFDHALNQFISIGKGTVSNDGRFITSDPGFGITGSGWGGGGPPPLPTGDAEDDPCQDAADAARNKANGLANSDPTKLFANAQACIAERVCMRSQNANDFDNPDWLDSVLPDFIEQYVKETGDWSKILQKCKSSTIQLNLPVFCVQSMASYHISQDLKNSLIKFGCGTDDDWRRVRDEIKGCAEDNFPLIGKLADRIVGGKRDEARNICIDTRKKLGQPIEFGRANQ